MARKRLPYNDLTTKEFRKRGWYYAKAEHTNPYLIIEERNLLRTFRDRTLKFCSYAKGCNEMRTVKDAIYSLENIAIATKIEKYNRLGEKKDMFGFVDYVVISPFDGVMAVQLTSASGRAEHRRKILRNDNAARWVNFDKIWLWTWRKSPQVRGGKRKVWKLTEEEITLDMFKEAAKCQCQPVTV